jgi:hypothetical protein
MSFNTWCLSLTRLENLPTGRLQQFVERLKHMISVYEESCSYGGRLERKARSEIAKCMEQMNRVQTELELRGM